jgi:hypothetical protein
VLTSPRPLVRHFGRVGHFSRVGHFNRVGCLRLSLGRPKDGPVGAAVEPGVVLVHREARQPLLPFDEALVRHAGVEAQPVVVEDDADRDRLRKLHQLAKGLDVRSVGPGHKRLSTRTPQRARVAELQRERRHLAGGWVARYRSAAVLGHMDGRIAHSQVVGVVLHDKGLLVSAEERHTRPQHQRDLLARLMVLDAQRAGEREGVRGEVDEHRETVLARVRFHAAISLHTGWHSPVPLVMRGSRNSSLCIQGPPAQAFEQP